MLSQLLVAALALALFALARPAPVQRFAAAKAAALGAVLGLLGSALAALPRASLLRGGAEEASAILLLVAVGASSVRWSRVATPELARERSAQVATVALMGAVGAWAGMGGGPGAAIVGGLAVGAAGWVLHDERPRLPWLLAGLAVFASPLMEGRMAPERALEGFSAIAIGALLGWFSAASTSLSPRLWVVVVGGFFVGSLPSLLAV